MAHTVRCKSTPRGPEGPSSAKKAEPTTTVGSTKGTVTAARKRLRPGKSYRAKTYAPGRATITVRIVDTTACQTVNHATFLRLGRWRTSLKGSRENPPSPLRLTTSMLANGERKKKPRKRRGTPTA